jgi:hypothetical protein
MAPPDPVHDHQHVAEEAPEVPVEEEHDGNWHD